MHRVAVIGAAGFGGAVCAAIAQRHPSMELTMVTARADAVFKKMVPGCTGQPHTTIEGGGHFLQEDRGPELAAVIAEFIANS